MSRPLSSPPRMIPDSSDEGYVVVFPDDPTSAQEYLLPLVSPLFEATVNTLLPPFNYISGVADDFFDLKEADFQLATEEMSHSLFGPGSYLHDFGMWITEPFMDYPPSPFPLVGVEPNPGPPNGLSKAAARRLRRRVAASNRAIALGREIEMELPPRRRKGNKAQQAAQVQSGPSRSYPAAVAAAYSTGMTTGKPVIIRTGDDSTRIRHSELLALISGTVNFTSTTFPMQPGLVTIFPWLSTQCVGWEKYRFHSLRATFLTRTGTATPGSVIMSPDYDAADVAPTSEQQATSFHGAADDAPWKTITINFDMKRSRELFIRNGPLAANLDIKTYDFAALHVCTADGTAVNWGKIFLEYDVELINPQVIQGGGPYVGGVVTSGGTTALTNPLGTAPTVVPGSIISSVTSDGTKSIVNLTNLIVGGCYEITNYADGGGLTAITTSGTGGTFTAAVNDLVDSAATRCLDVTRFVPTNTNATVTMSATGVSCSGGRIWIAPTALF